MTTTTTDNAPAKPDIRYTAVTYIEPNSLGEYGIDIVTYALNEDGEPDDDPGSWSWFNAPRDVTTWVDVAPDDDHHEPALPAVDAFLWSIGFRRVDDEPWQYMGEIADAGEGYEVAVEPVEAV